MIDREFLYLLEDRISELLENSNNERLKGFWCDGVLESLSSYSSKKYVNDSRQIVLKAFVGKDGQTEYDLVIKFGKKALSKYARNLDIKECLPSPFDKSLFKIDTEKLTIEIKLL